eukprot:3154266-Pyramimonas_sp.AAC.1
MGAPRPGVSESGGRWGQCASYYCRRKSSATPVAGDARGRGGDGRRWRGIAPGGCGEVLRGVAVEAVTPGTFLEGHERR